MDSEIEVLLATFRRQFEENLAHIKSSGAVPDDMDEVVLAKLVLRLTGERVYIGVNTDKYLRNLRKFI